MPGGSVTELSGTGLVGKLPTHGDFVRRGGDPALLMLFDRWLEEEIGRTEPTGLADRLATMPSWRFVLPHENGAVLGAIVASHDKVGRVYPLLGFVRSAGIADADTCCEALEAVLLAASRGERDATDTLNALAMAAGGLHAGDEPVIGRWWRTGALIAGDELPVGAAFDQLLGPLPAGEPEVRS